MAMSGGVTPCATDVPPFLPQAANRDLTVLRGASRDEGNSRIGFMQEKEDACDGAASPAAIFRSGMRSRSGLLAKNQAQWARQVEEEVGRTSSAVHI
jgi:hypothetical protein